MAQRWRSGKASRRCRSSSVDSSKGRCRSRCRTSVCDTVCQNSTPWLGGTNLGPKSPHPQSFLDALMTENVMLTILLFLEAADATRFGSCCSELQAALRAPRVQPLWRRWFEKSGFVWWPYGGVCGASCRLEVDRDGFVLQEKPLQQQSLEIGDRLQPPAGYKHFQHEGWCCQFLWNARAWNRWKRGCFSLYSLPTDSHKLFMVSVHPKGVYASRAEATRLSPSPERETHRHMLEAFTTDLLQQQNLQQEQQHDLQQEQQRNQQHQQLHSPTRAKNSLTGVSLSCQTGEGMPTPTVSFLPGGGRCLLHAMHDKAAVFAAASDRLLCLLEPLGGLPLVCSKAQGSPNAIVGGITSKAFKDHPVASPSPRPSNASVSSFSSLETLELELESLISGGSCRRSSGKSRKNANTRHGWGSGWTVGRTCSCNGHTGGHKAAGSRSAAVTYSCLSNAGVASAAEQSYHPAAALTAGPAAVEVKEICRCGPRTSWLGCSVDAVSGLMACCVASNEQSSTGRRRRKKGGALTGLADACEYRVFDILAESEVAQLSIDGHLVHGLLLNFVFSPDAARVFAFDRWHREFFLWDLTSAVYGEPLEAAAIVNAHTDGILALDTADWGGSSRVLCGSRDETVSLYSIDPVVRLATFNGHQAEVSAICWLGNSDGWSSSLADDPLGGAAQVFASGSYDGQIKIWDARQGDSKSRAGLTLVEHQNRITRLAGAWDGRILVSGDVDGIVKSWDMRKCADSLMTAQYNGAILDLQANRAFCVVRASPSRGRDSVYVLDFSEGRAR